MTNGSESARSERAPAVLNMSFADQSKAASMLDSILIDHYCHAKRVWLRSAYFQPSVNLACRWEMGSFSAQMAVTSLTASCLSRTALFDVQKYQALIRKNVQALSSRREVLFRTRHHFRHLSVRFCFIPMKCRSNFLKLRIPKLPSNSIPAIF